MSRDIIVAQTHRVFGCLSPVVFASALPIGRLMSLLTVLPTLITTMISTVPRMTRLKIFLISLLTVSVTVFQHFLQCNTNDVTDYEPDYKSNIVHAGVAYGMFDIIIDFDPDDAPDSVSHIIFDVVVDCVALTIEATHEFDIVVGIADGASNIITDYDTDYISSSRRYRPRIVPHRRQWYCRF